MSIFSFPAASIVKKLGERCAMCLGSMTYTLLSASFILPLKRAENPENKTLQGMYTFIYVSLLVCALILGWGASILWVGYGKYMSEIANDSNKGKYIAIFWAFSTSSLIIGSSLGAFLLKYFSPSTFYLILVGFNIIGALLFLVLPTPPPQK